MSERPFIYVSFELGVDVVRAYVTQLNTVNESHVGLDELDSQLALVDHADFCRSYPDMDSFGAFTIGSTFHVTKMTPSTSIIFKLPLLSY